MIYLHIPFCHRKCTYCAFYSIVTSKGKQEYVDALCRELVMRKQEINHPVRTLYFGGGTPSLLSIVQLGQIAQTLQTHYNLSELEEATIEANPEDLTPQYLHELRGLNLFNRVSIGIQSFHDNDLIILNRRHSASQAKDAVEQAYAAGFNNISVDLIYGLPNQSVELWQDNLRLVGALPVNHLSAYSLTIEPGTILYTQIEQGRVREADEEETVLQYESLLEWSVNAGFEQYEISNFCKPSFRSKHNSRYWDRTPYLGVGAAAHSFNGCCRRWNVPDVQRYISSVAHGEIDYQEEELSDSDAYNEYLMTALRTTEGIEKSQIAPRYADHLFRSVKQIVSQGFLIETPTHFKPTQKGLLFADGIAVKLSI